MIKIKNFFLKKKVGFTGQIFLERIDWKLTWIKGLGEGVVSCLRKRIIWREVCPKSHRLGLDSINRRGRFEKAFCDIVLGNQCLSQTVLKLSKI